MSEWIKLTSTTGNKRLFRKSEIKDVLVSRNSRTLDYNTVIRYPDYDSKGEINGFFVEESVDEVFELIN